MSPYLSKIRLKPEVKKGFDFSDKDGDPVRPKNSRWARNLARAFKIDVLKCGYCGGVLKPIAALTDPGAIKRYLTLRHQRIFTCAGYTGHGFSWAHGSAKLLADIIVGDPIPPVAQHFRPQR